MYMHWCKTKLALIQDGFVLPRRARRAVAYSNWGKMAERLMLVRAANGGPAALR
jgi:hypothetical protein